jgi:hypothetical protein
MRSFRKDPDAVLDYGFNWNDPSAPGGPWLATGETISTSAWTIPDGLTKGNEAHDDSITVVWLSGGTAGQSYTVTNRITSSAGRTDDRSFEIAVEER